GTQCHPPADRAARLATALRTGLAHQAVETLGSTERQVGRRTATVGCAAVEGHAPATCEGRLPRGHRPAQVVGRRAVRTSGSGGGHAAPPFWPPMIAMAQLWLARRGCATRCGSR